jgi:Raf kinase inhibitor-like YbhB/YbcL family protein
MPFHLTSSAFQNGEFIPKQYTCDGADVSPSLGWSEPPTGTKSLALIMDDPDAPAGTWVHWVLYDLPGDTRKLEEGIAKDRQLGDGMRQGRNDFGKIGYDGPCPPRGGPHRYYFRLYALDRKMNLKTGASKAELERAIKGHVLAEAEIVGRFQH